MLYYNESVTKCDKLKLQSADGKYYKTDVADVGTLLRLIQSVPSPKAEPVKLWLAKVGMELEQKTGKNIISGSNYLPLNGISVALKVKKSMKY